MGASVQPQAAVNSDDLLAQQAPGSQASGAVNSDDLLGGSDSNPDAAPHQGFRFFSPASKELGHAIASIPAGIAEAPEAVGGLIDKYAPNVPGVKQIGEGASWLGQKLAPVTHGLQGIADQIAPAANREGMTPGQKAALTAVDVGGSFAPSIASAGASDLAGIAKLAGVARAIPGASAVRAATQAGTVDAGKLAQGLDADMAASKAAAEPLWDQVRAAPSVSGPRITKLLETPDAPRAYESARLVAANGGTRLPAWGETIGAAPEDVLTARTAADNPTWTGQDVKDFVRSGAAQTLYGDDAGGGLTDLTEAAGVVRAPRAVQPMVLQHMKQNIEGTLSNAFTKPAEKAQAAALYRTLQDAINEARGQSSAYDQALAASEQYKSLEGTRAALEPMLSPEQSVGTAAAAGQVPANAPQVLSQTAPGAYRGVASKAAGAAALQAAGHDWMAIGMAAKAATQGLKAAAQGSKTLDAAQLAKLILSAGPVGGGRLLPLLQNAAASAPTTSTGSQILQALQGAAALHALQPGPAAGSGEIPQ